MPTLTEETRRRLKADTLEAAVALVDDLSHMRGVLGQLDPSPGDIRRLTAQLRRILIERVLSNVAQPRIGRVNLTAPDNKAIVASNRSSPIPFCLTGGVELFGVSISTAIVERASKPRLLLNYGPSVRVLLKLDGFLNQSVICFEGQWVTRGEIIKYIANVAHGILPEPSKKRPKS